MKTHKDIQIALIKSEIDVIRRTIELHKEGIEKCYEQMDALYEKKWAIDERDSDDAEYAPVTAEELRRIQGKVVAQ